MWHTKASCLQAGGIPGEDCGDFRVDLAWRENLKYIVVRAELHWGWKSIALGYRHT